MIHACGNIVVIILLSFRSIKTPDVDALEKPQARNCEAPNHIPFMRVRIGYIMIATSLPQFAQTVMYLQLWHLKVFVNVVGSPCM